MSPLRSSLIDGLLALLAGVCASALAAWAMGVNPSNWRIPWNEGDVLPVYSYAENMARGNWFLTNPDLGLPMFQDHGHFPVTDLISIAQIRVLAQFTSDPIAAVNVFTLGTFFTVALVTSLAFRPLGVSRAAAFVLSLTYALLPWHFSRAAGHVFLASYMSIPLALIVINMVARRRFERPHPVWLLPVFLLIGLLIGMNGIYYALLSSLIVAAVLVVDSVRSGIRLPHWKTMIASAAIPAGAAIAMAMNRWSISTAATGESIVRNPSESILYGGALSTIFFPAGSTATGRFVRGILDVTMPREWEGDALLSSAAVLAVVITCLVAGMRWATERRLVPGGVLSTASFWPGIFLVTCGFLIANGFGTLFSYWVSSDIRAWGRFTVYGSGVALLVTGLVITAAARSARPTVRWASVGALIAVATLTVADLNGGGFRLNLALFEARDAELRHYVGHVEGRLPDSCRILQWPIVDYPEMPAVNGMFDYSHLWPYIYSDDLRFSYGAVKGTSAAGWGQAEQADPARLRALAEQTGFCGIIVDTAAFGSPGEGVTLSRAFGSPDVVSSSGRWLFFDIGGPMQGEFTYEPVEGFAPAEGNAESPLYWWMDSARATIKVSGNPADEITVALPFLPPPCAGEVSVRVDGAPVVVDGLTATDVELSLDSDGSALIDVRADSSPCSVEGDERDFYAGLIGQTPQELSTEG